MGNVIRRVAPERGCSVQRRLPRRLPSLLLLSRHRDTKSQRPLPPPGGERNPAIRVLLGTPCELEKRSEKFLFSLRHPCQRFLFRRWYNLIHYAPEPTPSPGTDAVLPSICRHNVIHRPLHEDLLREHWPAAVAAFALRLLHIPICSPAHFPTFSRAPLTPPPPHSPKSPARW